MKSNDWSLKSAYAIVLCVFALIGQGCTVAVRVSDGAAIKIEEASLAKVEAWEFGDLYEAVRIVPLETTPQALFAKVEQTIVTDSLIFVRARYSDTSSDAGLWQYDCNGKFLRQIGDCGGGPGEYSSISHIVLRNDTLFAFDKRKRKLHLYNATSGEFLASSHPDGFEPLISGNTALTIPGTTKFLLSSDVHFGDDTYALAECDPMRVYFKKILPQKYKVNVWISFPYAYPTLSHFNDNEALYLQPLDETIYRVEYASDQLNPFVKICTEADIPEFDDGAEYDEALEQASDEGYTNRIIMLYASKDYLIINRFVGSMIWDLRAQKGWQTLNGCKLDYNLDFPFLPMNIVEAQQDNTFICAYHSPQIKEYLLKRGASHPLITLANGDQAIDPDGNSVLVIYKLK